MDRYRDIFGYLHDGQGIVRFIKDGELRSGRDGALIAFVRDGGLHDPVSGEFICALGPLCVFGNELPERLKAKMK